MPFAIALFQVSWRVLERPSGRADLAIAALCLLNVVAVKPSFFFAFALVCPWLALREAGVSRLPWARLWPVVFGAACVAAQYYALFETGADAASAPRAGVRIEPFVIWSRFSSNIPASVLASTLFPAAHLVLRGGDLRESLRLRCALLLPHAAVRGPHLRVRFHPHHRAKGWRKGSSANTAGTTFAAWGVKTAWTAPIAISAKLAPAHLHSDSRAAASAAWIWSTKPSSTSGVATAK
jgi:hypothetical protein